MASGQACRICRRRKVKCDRLPVCSNCQSAKTPCEYSPPKKRGPKPVKWQDSRPEEPLGSTDSTISASHSSGVAESLALPTARGTYQYPASGSPLFNSATAHPLVEPLENRAQTATRIHLNLLEGLQVGAPSDTVSSIVNHCIFLYTQYAFGAFPMCHEGALRATANCFFISPSGGDDPAEDFVRILSCLAADNEWEEVEALRSLTLLTALCASVSYVIPEALLPNKHLIAPLFLRASRETLRLYADYDVEHPNSSSLVIRLFLSGAIQTARGTQGLAFHVLGEAGLMAMRMRLFDESSFEGLEPMEENILRNAFWQLYICDKTALVMKNRSVTIHESLFDTGLTLKARSRSPVLLFVHGQESADVWVEDRLLEGFHVIRRMWTMAAQVIQGMEANARRTSDAHADTAASDKSIVQLSEAYFEMITLSNSLPTLVRPSVGSSADSVGDAGQRLFEILQRQRTSYLITLHSIKVLVLSTAIQYNMTEAMGLSAEPLTLARRKIELAQDLLNVLESVPFVHLQSEGEQCVEKVRQVGSLLLELAHSAENDVIKSQANQCAVRLIDMLVRLDSKASDVLGQQLNFS